MSSLAQLQGVTSYQAPDSTSKPRWLTGQLEDRYTTITHLSIQAWLARQHPVDSTPMFTQKTRDPRVEVARSE